MDLIEQAVVVALSPTAEAAMKTQAMNYCEQVKASPDGWKLCLELFVRSPRSTPEARLFALQVVEEVLQTRFSMLSLPDVDVLRQQLLDFCRSEYATPSPPLTEPEPVFLRNKLAHTLTLLFAQLYLTTWSGFFDDLLALLPTTDSAEDPTARRVNDLLFRVWMSIDEECVSALIPRSREDLARNTLLKDKMREVDVAKLASHWYAVLQRYVEVDALLINMSLKVISVYVSWIDISFIVNDAVMPAIFSLIHHPSYRVGACDCLGEVVGKGMKPGDKLALIQAINVSDLISGYAMGGAGIAGDSPHLEDEELQMAVARLVSTTGLELRMTWDEPELRAGSAEALASFYPYILGFIGYSEDDGEVTSRMYPVVNEVLSMFKKMRKIGGVGSGSGGADVLGPTHRAFLVSLIQGMIQRMEYPRDREWEFPEEEEEDGTALLGVRRSLGVFLDNIAQLDRGLFQEYVLASVSGTLDRARDAPESLHWTEVELSLHLLHLTGETIKGPLQYVVKAEASTSASGGSSQQAILSTSPPSATTALGNGSGGAFTGVEGDYTPLGAMVAKLVEGDVTGRFAHPAVCLGYLECISRYVQFFEGRKAHLSAALGPFIDQRGLHHPSPPLQHRAWYLFHRFVKAIRPHLAPFVGDILQAIPDLLIVRAEVPSPSLSSGGEDTGKMSACGQGPPTVFDQHLYLFEAAGQLISAEAHPGNQAAFLERVMEPIVVPLQQGAVVGPEDALGVLQRHHLIMAIGALAKGFPDATKAGSQGQGQATGEAPWMAAFGQSTTVILRVLEGMNGVEKIREASRYTAARLVNCLGTGILPYLPRLISALLTECDMGELTDFLPFTGLVVHKFRPEIFPIINDLLWPLISRVFLFLNRTATGTDEAVGLMELRKSYLTLIISLFNADVEGIFISERNVSHLNTILQSILHYTKADMDYENQTQKAAFGILLRMVDAWAGREEAGAEVPVVTPAKTAGGGGKGPTQRLPGFEQFLYESVTPVCFQVVMNPGFNFGDGQSLLIVSEITNVLRKVYERRGEEFVQFLSQVYLPSIQCPVMLIEEFIGALRTLDAKQFRKYFQSFVLQTK